MSAIPDLPAYQDPKLAKLAFDGFLKGYGHGVDDARLEFGLVNGLAAALLMVSGDAASAVETAGAKALRAAWTRLREMPIFVPIGAGGPGGFTKLPKAPTAAAAAKAEADAAKTTTVTTKVTPAKPAMPEPAKPAPKPQGGAASSATPTTTATPPAAHAHHPWPKYLGGPASQDLATLPETLHKAYHSGLDKILPRQRGTAFYENLSPQAKQQLILDLAAYTKAFDAKYGTHLYQSMVRNGFPAP